VVTVACPLDTASESKRGSEPPFGRRVTACLMSSLTNLGRALEAGDPDAALKTNGQAPPLSANLCEGLLEMIPQGEDSSLTVSVRWDHTFPQHPEPRQSVRLRHEFFGRIEALAARLRPSPPTQPTNVCRWVGTLDGRPSPEGQREGPVTLQLLLPEGETIRARADLSAADHHTAWLAYERNRVVMLQGILRGPVRAARIEEASGFRMVEDPVPV
jgi:hypothetical protein